MYAYITCVQSHSDICGGGGDYLLDVSDIHELNHFILFGAAGSGTGALKAQVAIGEKGRKVS